MASSVQLFKAIQGIDRPVFTTREIAWLSSRSISSVSQALTRLSRDGLVVQAARGLWCIPDDPRYSEYLLGMYLAGNQRAYVSFFSALFLHGVIEQIPQVVYLAFTAHSRIATTPLGRFSYHRIEPGFFAGFDWYQGTEFLIAEPEKALIDCLYVSSRRGKRFGAFPELDLSKPFRRKQARDWVARIPDPRIRKNVERKLSDLL